MCLPSYLSLCFLSFVMTTTRTHAAMIAMRAQQPRSTQHASITQHHKQCTRYTTLSSHHGTTSTSPPTPPKPHLTILPLTSSQLNSLPLPSLLSLLPSPQMLDSTEAVREFILKHYPTTSPSNISSITRLSGGFVNFVFRVEFATLVSLSDGSILRKKRERREERYRGEEYVMDVI